MRKSGTRIGAVIWILALVYSCAKKPLPEVERNTPEFYLEATVNGESVKIGAGENNYFMYSSYYFDTNQVYVLKAELSQTYCKGNCGYGLSILINDKKTSLANDPIAINQALQTGPYIYNDDQLLPLFYKATVKPLRSESSMETYRWVVNGQEINSYTASLHVENGKTFSPTLNFEDVEGICSTSHTKQYKVGSALQTNIEVHKEGLPDVLMYSFATSNKGTPPFKYAWDFGDGTSVDYSERPFHSYKTQGFFTTKLILIDNNNDTCVSFYQVPAFIDPRCEANFTTSFTPVKNTKGFSATTVLLTHPDGRVFSSQGLSQSYNNRFEILEISDYELNSNNEATKKIKIRFSCTVKNASEEIKIENAEAVLAVSYK